MSRFDNVQYDDRTLEKSAKYKEKFEELEVMVARLPEGRSKALAITHLEEAFMWVGKGLRDAQLAPGARGTKRMTDTQPVNTNPNEPTGEESGDREAS